MSEVEKKIKCENCDSKYTLVYETENVYADDEEPNMCPFCGDDIEIESGDRFDDDLLDELRL